MIPKVIIKKTSRGQKGVFAKKFIKKGELILERKSKVISLKEFRDLSEKMRDRCFPISSTKHMLPDKVAKELHHSCEPNAGIVNNKDLRAMKDIKKGEEISYDYSTVSKDSWNMRCDCGSKKCRKIIKSYKSLSAALKKKYTKFTPAWIKKF